MSFYEKVLKEIKRRMPLFVMFGVILVLMGLTVWVAPFLSPLLYKLAVSFFLALVSAGSLTTLMVIWGWIENPWDKK